MAKNECLTWKKLIAIALIVFIAVILIFKKNDVPHQAAIVSNGLECAPMARKILKDGGSVADAAIVVLLCEGVALPQSTGLGGGFMMTIFRKESNKVEILIARDIAPLAATEHMFVNDTNVSGGKASAVPGTLKGYWELHQKYGKLPWSQLFDPVIELCRNGHRVSPYFGRLLQREKALVLASPTVSKIFVNPKTNDVFKEGDIIKRPELADTLEIIQREGVDAIYNNGSLGRLLVEDIQNAGGIITVEDFMQYNVRWEQPISITLKDNKTLHTMPLPGSGALIAFIVNVLNDYLPQKESTLAMQRIAETFKFAYAQRTKLADGRFVADALKVVQNLTDPKFAAEVRQKLEDFKTYQDFEHYGADFSSKDDAGTAHINIIAPNGDAIAATASINDYFGNKIISRTGIILNDAMDDFSTPGKINRFGIHPSPANFIRPRKMPLSSMCPTILLDNRRNVEMILGSAGGSRISSAIAYVLLRLLYFKDSVKTAVNAPRIHHQLAPMQLEYEDDFPANIVDGLRQIGHTMFEAIDFSTLTAIGREGEKLVPVYDKRRGGSSEVY